MQSNAHIFPEHQNRQHLAQRTDKQEKTPGAASGPPVMIQAVHHDALGTTPLQAAGDVGAEPSDGTLPFPVGSVTSS